MRKVAVAFFVMSAIFVAGCSRPSVVQKRVEALDFSLVVTRGNYSYIPLSVDLSRWTTESHVVVLETLRAFEAAHPELEVTCWTAQKWGGHADIMGLWVTHRPRVVAAQ